MVCLPSPNWWFIIVLPTSIYIYIHTRWCPPVISWFIFPLTVPSPFWLQFWQKFWVLRNMELTLPVSMHWIEVVRRIEDFMRQGHPKTMEAQLLDMKDNWLNADITRYHDQFHQDFTTSHWGSFHVKVLVELLLPGVLTRVSNQSVSAFAVLNLHVSTISPSY